MRIWIVDDSDLDLMINEKLITNQYPDAEIKTFISVKDLQNDIASSDDEEWPQMIISDLNMPLMGGFDLVDYIQKEYSGKNIRFLLLSATVRTEELEKTEMLGSNVQIHEKPLDVSLLSEGSGA